MRSLMMLSLLFTPSAGDGLTRTEADEAERLCAAELPHWKLTADGVPLDAPKESVLKWTNPFAGRVYGNTYVWLRDGRPAAVSCLFRIFDPWRSFNGEWAALTGTKLEARRNDTVVWRPTGEWSWKAMPGAPAPAATAAQRLAQMRALADGFAVEVLDTRHTPKGENQTPRLLPRPLYRYHPDQTRSLDGGLFAFVLGTDPELMLLVECDTAAARPEWRFGAARMNRDAVRLKRNGATVWEVEANFGKQTPEDPYVFLDLGLPRKGANP